MILTIILGIVVLLLLASILTNPFSRLSIVKKPYEAQFKEGHIVGLTARHRIIVRNNFWWVAFAWLKCGIHVLETRYVSSPRSKATTVKGIIKDVHRLRYDPSKLLLISGDHFNALYVRNLGVFYYPLLDSRIPSSDRGWHDRQIVYLETVAFALGVFQERPKLATTIVSTAAQGVTCVNFYAYPSDSLYGIVYALAVLSGLEQPRSIDYTSATNNILVTKVAAITLQTQYKDLLTRLYKDYERTVYDTTTGLIRASLHLSGAKDITRRECAFYDNVIFWKTTQLAMRLNLIPKSETFLSELKERILQRFWLPKKGYFLEDLSSDGQQAQYYSSDWLVVLFTGFLDPLNKQEQAYFSASIQYIDTMGIDRPFALKYHNDRRAERQFLPVRLAVAAYGGDAIWSFWGMEYIKVLIALYSSTSESKYLKKIDYHIEQYKSVMLRDQGFPEVFDSHGKLLQTPFYRSIRQTGWVIGFEQVLAMRAALSV